MGRPKGTKKRGARNLRVGMPVNQQEKELLEDAAKIILKNNPDYVDTGGTISVWRKYVLDKASEVMRDDIHSKLDSSILAAAASARIYQEPEKGRAEHGEKKAD